MKISLEWVKSFINYKENSKEISEILTQTGLEVEGLEQYSAVKGNLEGVVIGHVLTCEQHPNADRLRVTTVDIGEQEPSQIVCGAPNVTAGQTVAVATVGAMLYPIDGEPFKIKKSKIRGEASHGMICAEDELGLGASHDGIITIGEKLKPGTPASDYFDIYRDTIVEIGLTPNRSDAISHIGVARDLKAVFNTPLKLSSLEEPKNWILAQAKNAKNDFSLKIEDKNACPRFCGVILKNINAKPSPKWVSDKLQALGIKAINNIVDITNYVMLERGVPMHAYDLQQINGNGIKVGFVEGGTTFKGLDDKSYKLDNKDIMVKDGNSNPMCIAGVFGGANSGVGETTTAIFLESAYWNPSHIRKTAARHHLKTDAAFRNERGVDPNACFDSIIRASQLLKEIHPEIKVIQVFDEYPETIEPVSINLSFDHISRLIGVTIPKDRIKNILINLDFEIIDESQDQMTILSPTYRVDVTREADVIEEILRIYGFNQVPLSPNLGTSFVASFPKKYKNQIQYETTLKLAAAGWNEMITNSLENPAFSANADWIDETKQVMMLNPNSQELSAMRQTMIFSGLHVLAKNINHRQNDIKFFEFGKVYQKEGTKYKEHFQANFFMTGQKRAEHWSEQLESSSFHDLKQLIYDHILSPIGTDDCHTEPQADSPFQYGVKVYHNQKLIGIMGLLSRKATAICSVEVPVFYAEFDWDILINLRKQNKKYQPVSKFPEVRRDLSLVLHNDIPYINILEIAKKTERKLLKDVQVFDIYKGKGLPANHKAIAIKMILQDHNKTLNEKTIDKTMSRLISAFETELNAVIRK